MLTVCILQETFQINNILIPFCIIFLFLLVPRGMEVLWQVASTSTDVKTQVQVL